MTEITTSRLRLRPFTLDDLEAHAQMYSDPEVMRYLPRLAQPLAQARQASKTVLMAFMQHWDSHGFGVWAVVDRATDTVLGQCGLRLMTDGQAVEVLYLLARAWWGGGRATEAAQAALAYGFTQCQLPRVVAFVHVDNLASRRVLEKIGLQYDSPRRMFNMDTLYYTLTQQAYQARLAAAP
jgi:ribosomal-protein-alanine N-acetyltransferase